MQDFDDFDDEVEEEQEEDDTKFIRVPKDEYRSYQKRAKQVQEYEAKAKSLERELAFDRAGIPSSGVGALFRKSYDGEPDIEAVKARALEYEIIKPPEPEVSKEEVEAHQQIINNAAGSEASSGATNWDEAIANAKSPDEVLALSRQAGRKIAGDDT